MKPKGTCLRFVKVKDIHLIPRYLFEQVKPRDFNIDKLYEWAPILLANPMNLLGAFIDRSETIRGVMWSDFNPITEKITVHILSVDKEYFGSGILKEADGIVCKFKKKLNAKGILVTTTRSKALEKIGYTKTQTLMEKV